MNRDVMMLEQSGRVVDVEKLATNFIDIISDCAGLEDFSLRNAIQDTYPLAAWLMDTSFARLLRQRSTNPQLFHKSTEEGVEWEMEIPGTVYTLEPQNSGDDCCWTMPDFAKCAGKVPMTMVCLKDCDKIFDTMVYEKLRINDRIDLAGFARTGEKVEEVNNRIRRLWMAFYTMHTAILGTMNTSDNIVKPFHGLLEVLQNDAVVSVTGANILAAFESLGCRMAVLGGRFVFAVNPLIYRSIEAAVRPDENGRLPEGWGRDNAGRLTFMGMGFISDKLVPVDMDNMTGDVWVLAEDAVGLFLAYALGNEKEVRDDFTEESKEDGCGRFCTYLYNFGTVANNNANRIAVISGVPVSSACTQVADLAALINPTTLVPAV